MRGGKPIPTNLRVARGNPSKRPLPKNEPKPEVVDRAKPPAWLSAEGKVCFKRAAELLIKTGVLTEDDVTALAVASETYGQWERAAKVLAREGETATDDEGRTYARPEVAIAQKARVDLLRYLVEFGLTPSSRVRVKCERVADLDPLEEFLKVRA